MNISDLAHKTTNKITSDIWPVNVIDEIVQKALNEAEARGRDEEAEKWRVACKNTTPELHSDHRHRAISEAIEDAIRTDVFVAQEAMAAAEARGAERERKRCVEIVKMATDDWASFDHIRKQIQKQSPPDKED